MKKKPCFVSCFVLFFMFVLSCGTPHDLEKLDLSGEKLSPRDYKKVAFFFDQKDLRFIENAFYYFGAGPGQTAIRVRFDVPARKLPGLFDGQGRAPHLKAFKVDASINSVFTHELPNRKVYGNTSLWFNPQDLVDAKYAHWVKTEGYNSTYVAYAMGPIGKGKYRVYILSDAD